MEDVPKSPRASQADGPFEAFRFRDFRLFWLGYFISQVGNSMQQMAVSWLLYDMTRSAFQLGLNGAFRAVPMIVLGLFGGTIADRFDRRRVLFVTQTILMILAFLLGFLAQTAYVKVWHVYALTLLAAIVQSVDNPLDKRLFLPSFLGRPWLTRSRSIRCCGKVLFCWGHLWPVLPSARWEPTAHFTPML